MSRPRKIRSYPTIMYGQEVTVDVYEYVHPDEEEEYVDGETYKDTEKVRHSYNKDLTTIFREIEYYAQAEEEDEEDSETEF